MYTYIKYRSLNCFTKSPKLSIKILCGSRKCKVIPRSFTDQTWYSNNNKLYDRNNDQSNGQRKIHLS